MSDYQGDRNEGLAKTAVLWDGYNCKDWIASFRQHGFGPLLLFGGRKKGKSASSVKKEFDDEIVSLTQPRQEKKDSEGEDETEEDALQRRKLATIMSFQGHASHALFYRADGVTPENEKEQVFRMRAWKYIAYTFKSPFDLIYKAFPEGDVAELVYHLIEVAGKMPQTELRVCSL